MSRKFFMCLGAVTTISCFLSFMSLGMEVNENDGLLTNKTTTAPYNGVDLESDIHIPSPSSGKAKAIPSQLSKDVKSLGTHLTIFLNNQTTGAVIIKPDQLKFIPRGVYADTDYTPNLPYVILTQCDAVLFDEVRVPRAALKCCHPVFMYAAKATSGFFGFLALSATAPGMTNGVLGKMFEYEVYGPTSLALIGVSVVSMGPEAFFQFYDLARGILEKRRISFIPATENELEDCDRNFPHARVFPKSLRYKFIEALLVPASTAYALIPIAFWLNVEQDFLIQAVPLCVPMMIYFAKPYLTQGRALWEQWHAHHFLIQSHDERESRRVLCLGLDNVREALGKDNKYILTKKLWDLIAHRTKNFGGGGDIASMSEEEMISALSCLISKSQSLLPDPEDRSENILNTLYTRVDVREDSLRESLASAASNALMALNIYPGLRMEGGGISKALSLTGLEQDYCDGIGYSVALLLASRILIEKEIHRTNFIAWSNLFSPDPEEYHFMRMLFRMKAHCYAIMNTAIFGSLAYLALRDDSLFALCFFLPFVVTRYLSLFDSIGNILYEEWITRVVTRNKFTPTPSQQQTQPASVTEKAKLCMQYQFTIPSYAQKKTQLYSLIKRIKFYVRYRFTTPTVNEISRGVLGTD